MNRGSAARVDIPAPPSNLFTSLSSPYSVYQRIFSSNRLIESERIGIKMKGPMYAMLVLGLVGCCFGANRECYECTYSSLLTSDSSCEAPSESAIKRTCDGTCMKTYSEVGSLVTITRSCTSQCIALDCVEAGGAKTCSTCCDTDLCNGAGSVTFNLVAMVSLIATVWGLSK
ncbi:ly-6/neurotoxin-like protein 1 [Asterias rubens]|uniref:ly-6/neurotoxin-like protein 1 n=1 Tax=Asterias rubens TaxID=7604 RepID=UPI0014557183|nr:ly-6/neurotoxin-like protein 1 [Asterias rubens]